MQLVRHRFIGAINRLILNLVLIWGLGFGVWGLGFGVDSFCAYGAVTWNDDASWNWESSPIEFVQIVGFTADRGFFDLVIV